MVCRVGRHKRRLMKRRRFRGRTVVLGVVGCDLSNHCDPGQIYEGLTCIDVPEAGTDAPGGDVGAEVDGDDGGAGGDGATSCPAYQGFGDTCTVVSQCSCGLDSCNTFMSANYCTRSHCLADPTICPPGWTCLDVSAFDPATGSACLRP